MFFYLDVYLMQEGHPIIATLCHPASGVTAGQQLVS